MDAEKSIVTTAKNDSHIASRQADAALEYLQTGEVATFSEVEEKQLVRKIDRMIVPLMWAIYFLQYQDKILSQSLLVTSPL